MLEGRLTAKNNIHLTVNLVSELATVHGHPHGSVVFDVVYRPRLGAWKVVVEVLSENGSVIDNKEFDVGLERLIDVKRRLKDVE